MIRDKNDADGSYFNIIRALTDTVRAPRLDSGCTQAWGPSDHVFLLPKGLPIPSKQKQKGSRESMEKGGVVVKIGIGCQGCLLIKQHRGRLSVGWVVSWLWFLLALESASGNDVQ